MPNDYSRAARTCDVIMKGGITSGIVYPKAVSRLALDYRFRAIGGASAGAIAAAATAAAEYGRLRGTGTSFGELETLPEALAREIAPGAGSRLFHLFQPQPETRRLFRTMTASARGERGIGGFVFAAVRSYFFPGLAGAGAALVLPALSTLAGLHPVVGFFGWLPWILLALVGGAAGTAFALLRDVRGRVPTNYFGLSTGMGSDDALTPWLHDLLQRLSGKPRNEPLTFGDLWGADPSRKEIDLQMMTTCLTRGRPYRLPFAEHEERLFFFKRRDFENLFPREVVEWMSSHARPFEDRVSEEILPIPLGKDFPVVVATRMSLSFPFLISAIPLQAIDYTRTDARPRPEPCWFSDGGIASNFPVHFFDAPLPGWPTFAINLRYFEEPPQKRVVMPLRNQDGLADPFHRFEKRGLLGFARAIFDAMQNWQDNAQAKLPGFRDRIAHVCLGPGEGGLNLDMPQEKVREIAGIGTRAGLLLSRRFAPGSSARLNWDNHRWIRFRSILAALEEMLGKLGPRLAPDFEPPQPGDENYRALVDRDTDRLPSYAWSSRAQRERALRAVTDLVDLAAEWKDAEESLAEGAPRPMPELRARPRI
jgi:predicted acylesterase/phospholipase RssA